MCAIQKALSMPKHPTLPVGSAQEEKSSLFVDERHREETIELLATLELQFPDFSRRQLAYMASAITHPQMDLDTKIMVVTLGDLAGPELTKVVSEDELMAHMNSGVQGATKLLLAVMPERGRA